MDSTAVKAACLMNLIRNLIAFVIIIVLLPIFMLAFRYTADLSFSYDEIADEIALCQLREMMLISYDLEFGSRVLEFRYKNRDCSLSLINGKFIMQPGTQIFLAELEDLHFEEKNGVIYVCYQKKNGDRERAIASQRGFYLDAFSDCDVRSDQSDSGEE